jgi:membrane associated rhomboid family serine protease
VIPLADDVERGGGAPLSLLLAAAAGIAACVALVSGDGVWTTLLLAGCSLWIWVFGRSVEDLLGRVWFGLLALSGGLGGVLIGLAAGMDDRYAAAAATGVAFEVVATHGVRFRGAHVLCLSPVPYFAGLVMTPAWLWVLLGGVLVIVLGAAGAYGG